MLAAAILRCFTSPTVCINDAFVRNLAMAPGQVLGMPKRRYETDVPHVQGSVGHRRRQQPGSRRPTGVTWRAWPQRRGGPQRSASRRLPEASWHGACCIARSTPCSNSSILNTHACDRHSGSSSANISCCQRSCASKLLVDGCCINCSDTSIQLAMLIDEPDNLVSPISLVNFKTWLCVQAAAAVRIQAAFRGASARSAATARLHAAARIQAAWRGFAARRALHRQRAAAVIQSAARGMLARRHLAQQHAAAVRIQAWWRAGGELPAQSNPL